jgi:serine/threonine protein kinase
MESPETNDQFSENTLITIFYNLLCSVNFMHSTNIIHRDLKPGNILVDRSCFVQICDFGQAMIQTEP